MGLLIICWLHCLLISQVWNSRSLCSSYIYYSIHGKPNVVLSRSKLITNQSRICNWNSTRGPVSNPRKDCWNSGRISCIKQMKCWFSPSVFWTSAPLSSKYRWDGGMHWIPFWEWFFSQSDSWMIGDTVFPFFSMGWLCLFELSRQLF